jgi:hypothetical protein
VRIKRELIMRDEIRALWDSLIAKQHRERHHMTALVNFAWEIDTPEYIFERLRSDLLAIDMARGVAGDTDASPDGANDQSVIQRRDGDVDHEQATETQFSR